MWRFIICAAATIGLVWILNSSVTVGSNTLPPMGKFISPSHGFWQNAERPEYFDNIVRLRGVDQDVRIMFDRRLVPHIYAQSLEDLYFAQGYVTAMHRLWQMDISTRASAGRIAEILGDGAIDYDKGERQRGATRAARAYVEAWKTDTVTYRYLEAYTAGINSYIEKLPVRRIPLEFKILNYKPEPWAPIKTAYFVRSMAKTLCGNEYDLEFSTLLDIFGKDKFDLYFPEYNPKQDPIIPSGTQWGMKRKDIPLSQTHIPVRESFIGQMKDDMDENYVGSNNWAVSGDRTASGNPILCNDPHLALSLPSIWYEVHLSAPGMNAYGGSLPGMPFILSGFNESIAWGETNAGHDVKDWYRIEWADDAHTTYMLDAKEVRAEIVIDTIMTKSRKAIYDTITYTYWGPVVKSGPYEGLAIHWMANDKPIFPDISVFMNINRSTNPREFMEAIDPFVTPAQNFVYADTAGNIAMRVGGALPLRSKGQGRFVSEGNSTFNGWTQTVPFDENPYVINPQRGFVSSANQRTTDDSYPYYYTGGKYFEDFRGITLNRYLADLENADARTMQQLQHSNFSLKAEEILPAMLGAVDSLTLSNEESAIVEVLHNWDYLYSANRIEPVYFEVWYHNLFMDTWDEFSPFADSLQITYPESWRLIDLALNYPDTIVFDLESTPMRESFQDIVLMSLGKAAEELSKTSVTDWGHYRKTKIKHLADLPGFSSILEQADGHGDALNATTETNGPSWRMIVELGKPVTANVIYPGGQSGNPGSMYYDNMVDDWEKGRYFKAHFPAGPDDLDPLYTLTIEKKGK